jgi:20S proteasome alpha/beta subunit
MLTIKRITRTLTKMTHTHTHTHKHTYAPPTDVGAASSGLTADASTLVEHARVETQNHWFVYNENMKVESITQSICDLALGFGGGGEKTMVRWLWVFGCAFSLQVIVVSRSKTSGGCLLYHIVFIDIGAYARLLP